MAAVYRLGEQQRRDIHAGARNGEAGTSDKMTSLNDFDAFRLSSEQRRENATKLCPRGLSLFCGEFDSNAFSYREWLAQLGGDLMVVSEPDLDTQWLRKYAELVDYLVVDSDFIGDVEDAVDFCMRVRRAAPQLPLLLISSEVRGDDLTAERMMACDVTLKFPLNEAQFGRGLSAAKQNNAHFRRSLAG